MQMRAAGENVYKQARALKTGQNTLDSQYGLESCLWDLIDGSRFSLKHSGFSATQVPRQGSCPLGVCKKKCLATCQPNINTGGSDESSYAQHVWAGSAAHLDTPPLT